MWLYRYDQMGFRFFFSRLSVWCLCSVDALWRQLCFWFRKIWQHNMITCLIQYYKHLTLQITLAMFWKDSLVSGRLFLIALKGTNAFCCTMLEIVWVTALPKHSVPCRCRGAERSNCAWLVPETERLQDAAAGIHAGSIDGQTCS